MSDTERRAPVQGDEGRGGRPAGSVPWSVHLKAWDGYAAAGHGDQSAERIAERGGFGYREMQLALAGRYREWASKEELPPVPGWEPKRGHKLLGEKRVS